MFAVGAQNIGNGVAMSSVTQEFSQGGVDFTDRGLDLAISGEGFFTMSDRGVTSYTRAGSFGVDRDGYVVNSQQQRLQIFPVASNGTFNTGTLTDLRLATADSPPQATTRAEFGINLPANATVPSVPMFDPANASSYNHSTAVTIYDSLGASHTATAYFVKTATPNQWEARFYIDGTAVGGANTMTYSNLGVLTAPVGGGIALPAYTPTERRRADHDDGRRPELDAVRLAVRRQLSSAQDGFASGRLSSIDVDGNGVIFARYTNGRSEPLGQVALSNFANTQGLRQLGDTSWSETFTSGDAVRGSPGHRQHGPDPVGRARVVERRPDRAARQHDHRAAQLPSERADDLDGRPSHSDDHQHSLTALAARGPRAWTDSCTLR